MSEFFIVVNFHNFPQKKDLAAYNLISRSNQSRLTRRGSILDSWTVTLFWALYIVCCSGGAGTQEEWVDLAKWSTSYQA